MSNTQSETITTGWQSQARKDGYQKTGHLTVLAQEKAAPFNKKRAALVKSIHKIKRQIKTAQDSAESTGLTQALKTLER